MKNGETYNLTEITNIINQAIENDKILANDELATSRDYRDYVVRPALNRIKAYRYVLELLSKMEF